MKIIEIKIDDFGCLSDRSFSLAEGFNLIQGENESGKSTLLAFIKFILYGLPRKTAENAAERGRAISLKSGTASGSLLVEAGGKCYTVYRRGILRVTEKRESYSEECKIIDEDNGVQVHKGEIPGELFLGVPSPVFESTCFMRQLGVGDIKGADISRALENMLMSADENVNLRKTLERLEGARKLYLHKNGKGGSLYELESERASLTLRLSRAMEDYNKIISKNETVEELHRTLTEKRTDLDRTDDMLSAAGMASVVKRFDLLHSKERELSDTEAKLRRLKSDVASADGYLPDRGFVSSISEASASKTSAQRALNNAISQLDSEERKRDEAAQNIDAAFDEKLRRVSPPERICGEITDKINRGKKKQSDAKKLMILGAVTLVASAALGVLIHPILFAALALSAAFFIPAVLGIGGGKRLLSEADETLSSYGVGLDTDDMYLRVAALERKIRDALSERARLATLDHDVSIARSAMELRASDLELSERTLSALLLKWNGGLSDPDSVIAKANEIIGEITALEGEATHLDRVISDLRVELAEYSEASLRARVPESLLQSFSHAEYEELERKKKFLTTTIRTLSEKCRDAERELMAIENECENPNRISAELESNRERYSEERLTYDALLLVGDALTEAGNDIRSGVTPILRSRAGEFMSILTDDKYSSLGISEDYEMTADTEYGNQSLSLLSTGTKDAAYLSLRLSLLSLLFKDELPPLAVDEALSGLDDRRAAGALKLLLSYVDRGGQCILFTCHGREERLIAELGIVGASVTKIGTKG